MKSSTILVILVALFVVAECIKVSWKKSENVKTGTSLQVNGGSLISVKSLEMGSDAMGRILKKGKKGGKKGKKGGKKGGKQQEGTPVEGRGTETGASTETETSTEAEASTETGSGEE